MPFPNGISPKVNIIARLKFKLGHFEPAIQPLRYGGPPLNKVGLGHLPAE